MPVQRVARVQHERRIRADEVARDARRQLMHWIPFWLFAEDHVVAGIVRAAARDVDTVRAVYLNRPCR